jgi:hypothetical protein
MIESNSLQPGLSGSVTLMKIETPVFAIGHGKGKVH